MQVENIDLRQRLIQSELAVRTLTEQLVIKNDRISILEEKIIKMSLELASAKALEDEHRLFQRRNSNNNHDDEECAIPSAQVLEAPVSCKYSPISVRKRGSAGTKSKSLSSVSDHTTLEEDFPAKQRELTRQRSMSMQASLDDSFASRKLSKFREFIGGLSKNENTEDFNVSEARASGSTEELSEDGMEDMSGVIFPASSYECLKGLEEM